jgi:hypothetical protein
VIGARRTGTVLLAVLLTQLGGCASSYTVLPKTLSETERTTLYLSVLRELRPGAAARPVVIDTLIPTREIDPEQYEKVITGLQTKRKRLDEFLAAQHRSGDQFNRHMLPSDEWTLVAPRMLDSLRALSRADGSNGTSAGNARSDGFWQRWTRAYPRSSGYVMLSPASVSRDGMEAIIHVRISCGAMCGESEVRLLKRDAEGVWRTARRVTLSVS